MKSAGPKRSGSGLVILLGRALGIAFSVLSLPLLARTLGTEGWGTASTGISVLLLAPVILSWGAPLVVRNSYARDHELGDSDIRGIRIYALAPTLLSAALASPISDVLFPAGGAPNSLLVTLPLSVWFGTQWLSQSFGLVGLGRVVSFTVVNTFQSVTVTLLYLSLWLCGRISADNVLWAQTTAYALTWLLSEALLRAGLGRISPFRDFFGRSRMFGFSQAIEAAGFRLDQILVLPLAGAAQAGLYSVAITIGMLPYVVGQAVSSASFRLVYEAKDHQVGHNGAHLSQLLRAVTWLTIIFGLFAGSVTPLVVPLVFGAAYDSAVPATLIALVAGTSVGIMQGYAVLLSTRGDGARQSAARATGLAITFTAFLVLVPTHGALGAAAASAMGYMLAAAMLLKWTNLGLAPIRLRLSEIGLAVRLLVKGHF